MKGIDFIPKCPRCGGDPTIYSYNKDERWPIKITGLLCGNCRRGPDPVEKQDPILTWIVYAAKR